VTVRGTVAYVGTQTGTQRGLCDNHTTAVGLAIKKIVTRRLYTLELVHKKLGSPLSSFDVH
jgi:hypothetical protein